MANTFDSDKKLLLLECGQNAVADMLSEELEKVKHNLLERKVKLEDLKKKNAAMAAKVREHNAELLGRQY